MNEQPQETSLSQFNSTNLLGLTHSLQEIRCLRLLPYVAMTVIRLSVRKSCLNSINLNSINVDSIIAEFLQIVEAVTKMVSGKGGEDTANWLRRFTDGCHSTKLAFLVYTYCVMQVTLLVSVSVP